MKKVNQERKVWDYLLVLHLIYPLTIIILHFINPDLYKGGDFLCFNNSVKNFYSDISQLYVINEFAPFRYFPLSPIFYSYLLLFNEFIGYIFTIIIILIGNLCLRKITLKIANEVFISSKEQINKLKKMMFVIFVLPFNFDNYYNGQMITLSLVFLLMSYYFFKKEEGKSITNNIMGGFFISCAILLKPFFIIILPFLLIIEIKKYKVKIELVSFFRYFFVIIMLMINLIIFILNSGLFYNFIEINSMYVFFESSQSLTNILFLTGLNPQFIYFSVLIIIYSILIINYLINGYKIDLFYFFGISILIIIISWPQTWPFYNLLFLFFLSLISLKLNKDKGQTNYFQTFWLYILLNILNLIIASILILIQIEQGGIHFNFVAPFSFLFSYIYFTVNSRNFRYKKVEKLI